MSVFKYEKDADGIVTITMDMTGPVNSMNEEYREAMGATIAKLEAQDGLAALALGRGFACPRGLTGRLLGVLRAMTTDSLPLLARRRQAQLIYEPHFR